MPVGLRIMFPMMPVQGNKQERQLIKVFKALEKPDQKTLLDFADFLQLKNTDASELLIDEPVSNTPLNLPRPDDESVIKAIKRLKSNYPMLDTETILNPISGVMTSHIMQGKKAPDAIDELEALFLKEYQNVNTATNKDE